MLLTNQMTGIFKWGIYNILSMLEKIEKQKSYSMILELGTSMACK